jgi:NAD(P)-dependent dehydrogenase (short-subunit alcohol dehydrogenase family)
MSTQRALVTGGGSGIGAAVVAALIDSGWECVIFDRTAPPTDAGSPDSGARTMIVDVSDPHAVARAVAEASAEGPFDAVVTSAGVALHESSLDVDPDQWRRVFAVNVDGTFWVVREAVRHMLAAGRSGAVVMIGSMSGEIANAPQAQAAYNASKGAVHALAKSLAIEWAPVGVRVNVVAPGYVGTPLTRTGVDAEWIAEWERRTPQNRLGTPDEIAHLVEFLISAKASYMTGAVVNIDGGYTAW